MRPDAYEQAEQLRAAIAGGDPMPQNFLVQTRHHQPYLRGTVTPAIMNNFEPLASGLLVPTSVSKGAQPIDQVKVYLTAGESLGAEVPFDQIAALLAGISLEIAVPWVTQWLAALHVPGATQAEVDARFADLYLAEPNRTKVKNLLRGGHRVLVTPQGLYCLLKLVLLKCPASGVHGEERPAMPLVASLLGLADYLGADVDEHVPDGEWVLTQVPGAMGREIIANQAMNSSRQETGRWASFQRCWRELPVELESCSPMPQMRCSWWCSFVKLGGRSGRWTVEVRALGESLGKRGSSKPGG